MKVKFIFLIICITIFNLFPSIVKSDDDNNNPVVAMDDATCLFQLLSQIYGITIGLICAESNHTNVYYKTTCQDQGIINTLYIESKDDVATQLTYNHLSCFSNVLVELTLFKVKIDSNNPFGNSYETGVSSRINLKECIFSDGEFPLVTSGKALSNVTQRVEITISQLSNFKKLRFSAIKYAKEFYFYTNSGMSTNFAEFVNDLQDSAYPFSVLYIQTNNIPSFLNTVVTSLYIHLVEPTSVTAQTSLGNLDSLNMIQDLHFIYDGSLQFPSQLSSANNKFTFLNLVGILSAPSSGVALPSSLKSYQHMIDSPNFNLNGNIAFSSFPSEMTSILINGNGLTTFPTNLPTNLVSLTLNNNNFGSELPDLSNYKKLSSVMFTYNGFIGPVKESYCSFSSILANNNLSGTLPKCKSCYINSFVDHFVGNPLLDYGTCEPGSIIPNILKYDSGTKVLSLTGSNLGLTGPTFYYRDYPNLKFSVQTKQTSFTFNWLTAYGEIPDILVVGIGSSNFTLPTKYLVPSISSIKMNTDYQIIITGSNFSYNKNDIQVMISNIEGTITFITFDTIIAYFGSPLPSGDAIPGTIKNTGGNLATNFVISIPKQCAGDCGFGSCDTSIGQCICNKGWVGINCDQIAPILCSSDCGESQGHGSCNTSIGECVCNQKWTDDKCSTPNQFLTSASSTLTTGGIVNLYGWLGYPNVDLSIRIGDLACDIKTHSETFANCSIGAGSGTKSITVYQNDKTWIGNNMFHYTELEYKCPKDCSLNGAQNGECIKSTGQCKCYQGWGGFDCNSRSDNPSSTTSSTTSTSGSQTPTPTLPPIEIPKSNTTINGTDGSAIITNQQTSYEISILSLVELDILDNIVLTHNLTNKWINDDSTSTNNNIHTFTQNITESCSIIYKIEEVKEPRDFEFAGLQLRLDSDTIKMTVIINNYPFRSSLNKLQLRIESAVGENNQTNSQLNNQCNNKDTQVDSTQIDQNQLLNYITISRNEKVLYGRFINRVLSDTRESFITTKLISNSTSSNDNKQSYIIGLDLPFFSESLVIDPDFSVLVSSSYKKCSSSSSRASWVLPVSIVVPVVGVAAIIIIGSIIIKKNRTTALMVKNKFKLKSLSKKNKDDLYMPSKIDK